MDWTKNYESLMRSQGFEPYACLHENCNHVARGTWGQLLHYKFGDHHMDHHRRSFSRKAA